MKLTVTDRHFETPDILALELANVDGTPLPVADPGAHVVVRLGDGLARQYSIYARQPEGCYRIAVKREENSRGGSERVHRLALGDTVEVSEPVNRFPMDSSEGHRIFLAGGIGITPLISMMSESQQGDRPFTLHYFARSEEHVAFREMLVSTPFAHSVTLHIGLSPEQSRQKLDEILGDAPEGSHAYVCGPAGFIGTARELAERHTQLGDLHWESFTPSEAAPPVEASTSEAFQVELVRSGKTLDVEPGQTILQVLMANGIFADCSCMEGTCGICVLPVLEGVPDHRDEILTDEEKAANDQIAICISRSRTGRLVLDI